MIKDYFLNKMIFPKIMIIDNPGIIISRNFRRLKGVCYDMRIGYSFEDFYVKLHKKTVSLIGESEASFLEYVVGKNLATRYFSFNLRGIKKRPKKLSNFMLKFAIKHLQEAYCAVGMSVCENANYDLQKRNFSFWGENNAVCRKTKDYSIMEGILSGSIGFLLGENIEAESREVKNGIWRVDLHTNIEKKHVSDFHSFGVSKNYKLNFSRKKINSRLHTLNDFLRFGIIKMDNFNKTTFFGKTLIPAEFSLPEIFAETYRKFGLENLFSDSVVEYSEKLFSEMFSDKNSDEEKMKFFRNMLSAFGYGQVFIRKEKNKIFVDFLNPMYLKCGFTYLSNFILGFFNYLYSKKFVLIEETGNSFVYKY